MQGINQSFLQGRLLHNQLCIPAFYIPYIYPYIYPNIYPHFLIKQTVYVGAIVLPPAAQVRGQILVLSWGFCDKKGGMKVGNEVQESASSLYSYLLIHAHVVCTMGKEHRSISHRAGRYSWMKQDHLYEEKKKNLAQKN